MERGGGGVQEGAQPGGGVVGNAVVGNTGVGNTGVGNTGVGNTVRGGIGAHPTDSATDSATPPGHPHPQLIMQ